MGVLWVIGSDVNLPLLGEFCRHFAVRTHVQMDCLDGATESPDVVLWLNGDPSYNWPTKLQRLPKFVSRLKGGKHQLFEAKKLVAEAEVGREGEWVIPIQSRIVDHKAAVKKDRFVFKDLMLDCDHFRFWVVPEEVPEYLPSKEARILRCLLERPSTTVSRDVLMESVWGGVRVTPRTIDSHVSRLRKRLEASEVMLEAVYGGGYRVR